MTGPSVATQEEVNDGHGITLDDIESRIKAAEDMAKLPDLTAVKVDGESVPEHLRGKTAAELLEYTKRVEESLKLSEQARSAPPAQPQTVVVQQQPAAPAPPPQLTREQLKEIYEQDPLQAFDLMLNTVVNRVEQNVEQRVAPLRNSGAASAEAHARQKYAEDFTLLGPEIQKVIDSLPDRSVLAQPNTWDDLVAYVRGQNIDKIIDKRIEKRLEDTRSAAQAAAVSATPANFTGVQRAPAPNGGVPQLDALKLEIAKNLGMTPEEYSKWERV